MRLETTARILREQRRPLLVWSLSAVTLVAMYAAIYPSIKGNTAYSDVFDRMPAAVRALFGASSDLTSPTGYITTEFLSFVAPLVVIALAVGLGSNAVAGEEERGTLDLLLAHPLSRTRLVVEKAAAMVAVVAVVSTVIAAALLAVGAPAGLNVGAGVTAATCLHLGLLGLEMGAVSLAVGAATGRLALARAAAAGVAVVTYVVNGLGQQVSWLRPLRPVSPFYQYLGHEPLLHGVHPPSVAITVASIGVLLGLAVLAFRRRDLAG